MSLGRGVRQETETWAVSMAGELRGVQEGEAAVQYSSHLPSIHV